MKKTMYIVARNFALGLVIGAMAGFLLFGCFSDDEEVISECIPGSFKCEDNKVMFCNLEEFWEDDQDCTSIGETCSEYASDCSGYSGIACCF